MSKVENRSNLEDHFVGDKNKINRTDLLNLSDKNLTATNNENRMFTKLPKTIFSKVGVRFATEEAMDFLRKSVRSRAASLNDSNSSHTAISENKTVKSHSPSFKLRKPCIIKSTYSAKSTRPKSVPSTPRYKLSKKSTFSSVKIDYNRRYREKLKELQVAYTLKEESEKYKNKTKQQPSKPKWH